MTLFRTSAQFRGPLQNTRLLAYIRNGAQFLALFWVSVYSLACRGGPFMNQFSITTAVHNFRAASGGYLRSWSRMRTVTGRVARVGACVGAAALLLSID